MSFYRSLPNDRPRTWFEEFRAEVFSDHRQLVEQRERMAARPDVASWSFDTALARTRTFYVERFTGYQRVGSITEAELEILMDLVEKLGTDDFPRD